MRWYWWMLTLLLPLCAAAAPADGITHHMQRWTQAQGAPLRSYEMAQTADGLLWFGTFSGLFDFDGVRFRRRDAVYGHRLPYQNVVRVAAFGDRLFAGYQTGGVTLFDPRGSRDWRAGEDGLPTGSIAAIVADEQGAVHVAASKRRGPPGRRPLAGGAQPR